MTPFSTLIVLLLVKVIPLPAQNVRAVDDYIYDTAPVAGIGVGERMPQRSDPGNLNTNQRQSKPEVVPRTSTFDHPVISKETEDTVSYVEDLIAGRLDPPKDSHRSVSESNNRNPPRPAASVDHSRGKSPSVVSGVTRADTRSNAERPLIDDLRDPVSPVRTPGVARPQTSGNNQGTLRDAASGHSTVDHRDPVPFHSDSQRNVNEGYQSIGGMRDSATGTKRDDPRGIPPGRQVGNAPSVPTGNSREYSRDDGPVYNREDQRPAVGGASRGTVGGNTREDPREDVMDRPRSVAVDRSRDGVEDYVGMRDVEDHRGTSSGNSRDSFSGKSHETVSSSRDTYTGNSHDTVSSNSRGYVPLSSRDTYVDNPRDTLATNPRDPYTSDSHETYSGDSRETYSGHSEESDRDIGVTRYPQVEHPVEEPLYTSQNGGTLESYAHHESDEEISVAHSARPLPKTQIPRQVAAVAQPRTARGPHPLSPCPSVFSYEGTRAGKERWYGVVLVTADETLTGVRLDIELDKSAHLLGTWLGEVSSVDNIRYTIWNGRRKIQPGPPLSVKVFVKYSDKEIEPPRVRSIRLNGRQICPKDKVSNMKPVPLPQPPRNPPARPNQPPHNRPHQPATSTPHKPATSAAHKPNRPAGNGRPTASVPTKKPGQSNFGDQLSESTELVDGVACGRIEVQPSPLITYGQRTARGQWPWHAAIYQSKGTDLSFICGGSLIGMRTVLTAAHCVSRRYIDRPVDPESLVVYLGKYHLKLWSEGGVQDKQVREVHVHPEYNSTDFQADIAILVLSSPVEFTVYVKPVCLWDRNKIQLSEVEGREGVVVGWGYDERGMVTEELMMAKMPVVSQQTCIWSYPQFFSHFTSDRTFCAGFRNGTSVCNGDSGGGMVFPKAPGNGVSKPHTWALRGIVSLSASQAEKRVCNTDHYVVFTDVVKFYDWIHKYR